MAVHNGAISLQGAMRKAVAFALLLSAMHVSAQGTADPLARLLLSGPWCSFSYNKTTGYSKTTRVQFSTNGTYTLGGRSEGYSSGAGGTFGSQSDNTAAGRWQVQNSQLLMTEGDGPFELIETEVTHNSSGNPVIRADGVEYTRCS